MQINKLADLQDMHQLARKPLVERLADLRATLEATGLGFSDHLQKHWLRMWEYSSAIMESRVDARMRVLDAGGTGTVFSYYLAAEGCEVTTVDIDRKKVDEAITLSQHLGLNMIHRLESITELSDKDATYDRVFCISVIEHINAKDQPRAVAQLARVLKPGGILSVTFDYGTYAADSPFISPEEVNERISEPSGLTVVGDDFVPFGQDLGTHSDRYTFGSLFLKKDGETEIPNKRDSFVIEKFPSINQELIKTDAYSLTNSFYETFRYVLPMVGKPLLRTILSEESYSKIENLNDSELLSIVETSLNPEELVCLFDRLYGRI